MSTETDQDADKGSSKEKRLPSITPRKFTRFFTPRSHGSSASRRVLFDVTTPANNRNGIQSSPIRPFSSTGGQENSPTSFTREMKRRKLLHTPSSCSDSSNCERSSLSGDTSTIHHEQDQEMPKTLHSENSEEIIYKLSTSPDYYSDAQNSTTTEKLRASGPIRSIASRGLAGTLLRMRLDSNISHRLYERYPASGKQLGTRSKLQATNVDIQIGKIKLHLSIVRPRTPIFALALTDLLRVYLFALQAAIVGNMPYFGCYRVLTFCA